MDKVNKRFIFDLHKIDSAKYLMATAGQYSMFSNQTDRHVYNTEDIKDDARERYDIDHFHYGRFDDYVWEICNPSKLISVADLPVKIDPEKVIFEFINHKKLTEILTQAEIGYLKEILNKNSVEIIWN